MNLPNARRIARMGVSPSTLKMLLLAAGMSRPRLRPLTQALLAPFFRDGAIAIRYTCHGRHYQVFLRSADLESDWLSFLEVAVKEIYQINPAFVPDLVLDGGANVGLFTLLAAASWPSAKLILCEPVPRNLAQLQSHLRRNGVSAEVLPVCLGGSRRTIPFYVREANQGSFDPQKPYASRIDVDVLTLSDVLRNRDARRILIKLDIEGMELETLESYVPHEERAIVVLGELHGHRENSARMERIFAAGGWTVRFDDVSDAGSVFEAWSPAATALLAAPPRS